MTKPSENSQVTGKVMLFLAVGRGDAEFNFMHCKADLMAAYY